jgi:pyroglutamyl-peptidase
VPPAVRTNAAVRPLRVLLTGFEPFGGEPVNPAEQLVRTLARGAPPDARVSLSAVILPVDRERFRQHLDRAVLRHRPDALLAVGQATGRAAVDLETRALNRLDYRGERDNGGHAAVDEALVAGTPERLMASLPLCALQRELARRGLPVRISLDAGRHLCNALLYHALLRHPALPAGFVHVPLLPAQASRRGRGEPHLPERVSRRCLEALIRALAERWAASRARGVPAAVRADVHAAALPRLARSARRRPGRRAPPAGGSSGRPPRPRRAG